MTLSRTLTTLGVLIMLACPPVWIGGCSTNRAFAMPEAAPGNFVLAVTVFVPPQAEPESSVSVPARYILEPDSTLRAAVGPGSSPSTYPSPTRTLSASQTERVWALLRSLDLSPSTARPIVSPETFNAPAERGVILIELRIDQNQHAYAIDPSNPQARALVQSLADLAWVRAD